MVKGREQTVPLMVEGRADMGTTIAGGAKEGSDKADYIIENYIECHCGDKSPVTSSWWKVQNWWRKHGFGEQCQAPITLGE